MNIRSMTLFSSLLTIMLLAVACSSGPSTWTVETKTTPVSIRPSIPFELQLLFKNESATAPGITGVKVTLTSEASKKTVELTPKENSLADFRAQGVVLAEKGKWTGTATLTIAGQAEVSTVSFSLEATCSGDKKEGSACCADTDCGDGLSCVYGSCSSKRRDGGAVCLKNGDCASGLCTDGKCVKSTCNDKKKNGFETDVDCGGVCGACDTGKACKVSKDCASGNECKSNTCTPIPGALLGTGDGSKDSVKWTVITDKKLFGPADLAFSPYKKMELWVVNRTGNAFSVIENTGKNSQSQATLYDRSRHFLEEVITISFGPDKTMGTCGDSRNTYDNLRPANNFMGPVLWDSDMALLLKYGAADVSKAHLDMLHSTPNCMGMAATGKNTFFVFNGYRGTLDWYDFHDPHPDVPHGRGGADHVDGVAYRYSEVKLKRVPQTPSNMVYDYKGRWLYIADTGNGRVLRINVDKAKSTGRLQSFPGDGKLYNYTGATIETVVDTGKDLTAPSGLALHKDTIYVADNATGKIHAYDLKGKLLRSLDTGLPARALGGLTVGPDDRVYFVDMSGSKILRIDPK